ncbi:hypothetical protein HOT31_gp022 [Microbacterium phage Hendrix]|uniref:Uncharacterized protein n=1 Tax=Microbacterium phage Hendrix TaxID=2182341 RepID=A0A2U8UUE5_9CAUD|nr:hypothetical protein HOT31_gp022 [Microbacterium phage Hendrix]AWN07693.1 hypothetical protein PBI_HENDRIX_22 [Microbacterium phage Hendrix]
MKSAAPTFMENCPTCGLLLVDAATAAAHYQIGCVPSVTCVQCGVPLPYSQSVEHIKHCIGQTAHILHNRKAGMVAYLTDEEWTAIQNNTLTVEQAAPIVGRAVNGVEFETVTLNPDSDPA